MLLLKKVAVTGGIGVGKTTFCQLFEELGARVVSADQIAHQFLSPHRKELSQQVVTLLGEEILVNGEIDRKKVAERVFRSKESLQQLEHLIHPYVQERMEEEWEHACEQGYTLFIVEVPLLFEAKMEGWFDHTVCVVADATTARKRAYSAKRLEGKDFDERTARQLPAQEKAKRSEYIIENNGSIADLKAKAAVCFQQLIR